MTQANVVQVTLTQEDAAKRRPVLERLKRRGAKRQEIPQQVLDYVLPRVRVEQYVDEEGTPMGECWIWLGGVTERGTPRGTIKRKNTQVRRWVAQQMRTKPIPADWWTLVSCEQELCVHPYCCVAMTRSKGVLELLARGRYYTEVSRAANIRARRAASPLTPEDVVKMRKEHAESILAGARLSGAELGRRYGITKAGACKILNGERWSPADLPLPCMPVASVFDLGRLA